MPKLIKHDRITGYVEELELAPRRKVTRALYGDYYVCSECGKEQSEYNSVCECCKVKFNGMTKEEEKNWKAWSDKLGQKFSNHEIPYGDVLHALWSGDLKKYLADDGDAK